MFKLAQDQKSPEQRQVIADTLICMMKKNNNVIALEADLGAASFFDKIQKECPNQMINVGIAEANMVGIASGLSLRGRIPFIHSFAPFMTRRTLDQIFVSGAYAKTTLNIYGSDPGICSATNGGTHTSFEDIALLRAIPETRIFDPADATQVRWLLQEIEMYPGVNYIRTNRKAMPLIYEEGSQFEIGKANVLCEGEDVLVIAMGETLFQSLEAVKILKESKVTVTVLDMFTVKPLDKDAILHHVKNKKLVVSFENHSINNGLGSAVAEVLSENGCSVKLKRLGVEESFGQVGSIDYLRKTYGLDTETLVNTIKKELRI